jgi:diguanylate cyclase (GGDEF)-like protein/PAS domain S-box-containing protein
VFRVLHHWVAQQDFGLVALTAVVCAAAASTSLHIYVRATAHPALRAGFRHRGTAWLTLAGICAGAGGWAAYLLAGLATGGRLPLADDPKLIVAALFASVAAGTAGFVLAAHGQQRPALGGAVLGLGMLALPLTGLEGMFQAGTLLPEKLPLAVPAAIGTTFSALALVAGHRVEYRRAALAAPLLLALAMFGSHLAAAAIVGVRPGVDSVRSSLEGSGLAVAVAAATLLVLLAAMIATHLSEQSQHQIEAELRRQHEALMQREEELRKQNEKLDAALGNMTQGLAMFDAQERLVLANQKYAEIYDIDAAVLVPGTSLTDLVAHRVAKGLYSKLTVNDVLANMRKRVALGKANHLESRLSNGKVLSVAIQPRTEGGWVVTLDDTSEREQLNARLERQNRLLKEHESKLEARHVQLDAALNNMVQGLAMFDADQRLVLWNRRYAELYGFTPDQLQFGTTLRALIEHRISNGLRSDRSTDEIVKAMLQSRDGGKSGISYTHLSDGRWLAVTVQPMADGGTVTTHHDITEQRRSEAKIAHMAQHDSLTGLPNRAQLNERLDRALEHARQHDGLVATHLLDLDHFKNVNDTLGHPMGDKLLKAATERLRALVSSNDTVARMGGDEFAIVQTGIVQPNEASALAQSIIESLSQPYSLDGQHAIIAASIGIAVGPADGLSPEQLLRNADLALYRAKGDGRAAFRFFEQEMDAQMQKRRALEYDLRKALGAGEFELHYQPVVNLERNRMSGVEALIRWHHPTNGMIPPATFIPLAEEIGAIVQIGEWAIREACNAAARWPDDINVAVNLSAAQFHNPGLVQVVIGALAASGLAAGRLELEITESILLQDREATLATLYQLRELGVRIAMDDFGTGYSSLSYLQRFPFDKIKIDRSFIRNIAESSGSLNIVRAVTAMANGLGMTTTAEGVETAEQLDAIKAEGCTEMQGFLFSRPLPASELEPLYLARHDAGGGDRTVVAA